MMNRYMARGMSNGGSIFSTDNLTPLSDDALRAAVPSLHPVTELLQSLLANSRIATDFRLNPHLSQADMAKTIRMAIECLTTQNHKQTLESEYEKALRIVKDSAFGTADPKFIGIPSKTLQAVIDVLTIPKDFDKTA